MSKQEILLDIEKYVQDYCTEHRVNEVAKNALIKQFQRYCEVLVRLIEEEDWARAELQLEKIRFYSVQKIHETDPYSMQKENKQPGFDSWLRLNSELCYLVETKVLDLKRKGLTLTVQTPVVPLYKQLPQPNLPSRKGIDETTTLLDVFNAYNRHVIKDKYRKRKEWAKDWPSALQDLITESKEHWFELDINSCPKHPCAYYSYKVMQSGKDITVKEWIGQMPIENKQEVWEHLSTGGYQSELKLEEMALGVELAQWLPEMEKEVAEWRSGNPDRGHTVKIKWKAGPAFLGHFIDELLRNGYADLPYTNKEKNAAFLLMLFDVKTTKNTLAIELSENSNSLTPENKDRIKIKPNPKIKNG